MAECALFGTYSFTNVALSINGVLVTGFDEGDDAISVEPGSELGQAKVGADGSGILSITADQSAVMTLRLLPVSPMNQWLRNRVLRQRSGAVTNLSFPIGLTDLSSRETAGCTNAMISGEPNTVRGVNVNPLEWKIWCACWKPGFVSVNGLGT